jgi:ferredoxin
MSLIINEECIACDACIDECPNEAIDGGDPIYVIDPDRCTECIGHYDEPACIAVCPVDCIERDEENRESYEELIFKYEQMQRED